jgi:hypothetical protein
MSVMWMVSRWASLTGSQSSPRREHAVPPPAPIPPSPQECGELGPFDAVPLTAEDVACTQHED